MRDRAQMILDGEEHGPAEERTETAAKMIGKGLDEQLITEVTGLGREQLSKLKERS